MPKQKMLHFVLKMYSELNDLINFLAAVDAPAGSPQGMPGDQTPNISSVTGKRYN